MILPIDLSQLPEQLRSAIADIAERRGPERPLALADLIAIQAAAENIRRAYQDGESDDPVSMDAHLDKAIGIPGAVLHKPTYGARIALNRCDRQPIPSSWQNHQAEWINLQAAFVLAHAYQPEILAGLSTPEQSRAIVEAWAAKLPATVAELAEAVRTLTSDDYPPVPDEKKKDTPEPRPSPTSCASCVSAVMQAPTTGSGNAPRPTSAGCSAPSKPRPRRKPKPPATAPPPPSPHPTPESKPSNTTANSTTN